MSIKLFTNKYKQRNLTKTFFRFLKNNNAYSSFKNGLSTKSAGIAFYQTLWALKNEDNGKKEKYANDPIKWMCINENTSDRGEMFLKNLINYHIKWSSTKENIYFWQKLHNQWGYYILNNFSKDYMLLKVNNKQNNINGLSSEDIDTIYRNIIANNVSIIFLTLSLSFFLHALYAFLFS